MRAIMNALVGLNFLAKTDGRYTLTPESSAFLVSTKPGFQGGILKHTSQQLIPKWLHLNEIVSAGSPPASVSQEGAGSEFFQNFVVDIFPMSYPAAQVLAKHLALDKTGTPVRVLDVAAGSGVWGNCAGAEFRTGQGDGRGLGRCVACNAEDGRLDLD